MTEPKMLYDVIQDEKTRELRDHLRNHLTDGYWHDDCVWCKAPPSSRRERPSER